MQFKQSLANSTSSRTAGAFTLIELLVVIGIIAVLIGILLPALAAARRSAQNTKCLALQRQIAAAVTMHAVAHKGFYPIAGAIKGIPLNQNVRPEYLIDANRLRYTYLDADNNYAQGLTLAPWPAAVANYMGKRATDASTSQETQYVETGDGSYLKYFLCPAHVATTEIQHSQIYQGGKVSWIIQQSYALNEAVFGVDDTKGRLRGNSTRIRRSAETMMFADGLNGSVRDSVWVGNAYNWITFANKQKPAALPITLADALAGNIRAGDPSNFDPLRHKGKINITFFDGHAETRLINATDLRDVLIITN